MPAKQRPFSCFLKVLFRTFRPRYAWHMAFHRESEQWALIQFRDGADPFYYSKHRVTCRKCRVSKTTQRLWPKFNADLNEGYQLREAHQQALSYRADSRCGC